MLYLELCTCKVVMRETTGGRAGTQPAACSSSSFSYSPRQREKKEKACPCAQPKTFSTSQAVWLHFFKAELQSCGTISPQLLLVHSNATAFSFWAFTHSVCSSYDKRELRSKMHPAVCTYLFLLTYFYQKVQPWSNHNAAERPDWAVHMYVCGRLEQTGAVWVFYSTAV